MKAHVTVKGFILLLLSACQLPYRFPKPGEPQSLVKVRRVYHGSAGTHLREFASIEHAVAQNRTVEVALTSTNTFPLPVHPKPVRWSVTTNFHHYETRTFNEAYQVSTPYQVSRSESYSCGYGSSPRTCSRMVTSTQYRYETRYRLVTRTVQVPDAACEVQFAMTPVVNQEYLLQHNFMGPGACSIACFRDKGNPDGQVSTQPCTAGEFTPFLAHPM